MRLLSLALGGALVDRVGIEPIFWVGGTLLGAAGLLGLLLLGHDDVHAHQAAVPSEQR
ncbi:MAG: hypothetical protein IVW57_14550 [Ktedonobacterales bacterium]|nr:hypothetical protein [Ktedonobacterales bacterium]